jgi:hypothetical protein
MSAGPQIYSWKIAILGKHFADYPRLYTCGADPFSIFGIG